MKRLLFAIAFSSLPLLAQTRAAQVSALDGRAARTPDNLLTLFDYPDPNITSEQRIVTNVPLQGLFFLNSEMITAQSTLLAKRLASAPS